MSGAGRNRNGSTGKGGAGRSGGSDRGSASRGGANRGGPSRGPSGGGKSAGGRSDRRERQERRPDRQGRGAEQAARKPAGRPPVRDDRAPARTGRGPASPSGRAPSGTSGASVRDGGSRPGAAQLPTILKMGRIKGEWMDIRLPDHLAGAPAVAVARHLPLSPKYVSKLMQNRGFILQGPNLRLHLFPREERDYPGDWMELNVLYEDEFTLVVNKPAGIEVHPSERGQRGTLAHAVAAYYEMTGQDVRIRHIHRIDKETTGPVLYAKNEFAHYQYDKAMRDKEIERIYVALAEGNVEGDRGTIDKPIGQDRHHSTRRRVSDTGDPAVTHFEVVERFRDHTLVRLRLETGRTHQIRVHMSAINHPLAGDGMYGGKRGLISRQALHGERLIWSHPWTGEKQQARAPLPDDFERALAKSREMDE